MTTEEMFQKLSEQLAEQGKQLAEHTKQLNAIQADVTAIKVHIENHVEPMLNELTGYATGNSQRITMVEGRTQALEDDKAINEVITEIKQKGMM